MALPANAQTVVVRGYWWDEATASGVQAAGGRPATVTFAPIPLEDGPVGAPNLRDLTASGFIKTRTRIAVVDKATGYFATVLVASDDPDLDAYAGREVTFLGEEPFTIEVPHDAPTVTVDAALAAAVGLAPGSSVKAIWLADCARVATPPPPAPVNYLSSSETLANIASAIEDHDDYTGAHPYIQGVIAAGDAALDARLDVVEATLPNKQPLDADLTAIAGLTPANDDVVQRKAGAWTNRTPAQLKTDLALTKSDVGLGSVDNTADAAKPVSTAQQTALNLKLDKSANLSDVASVTTTKQNLALDQVNNTSDANKPVSTATSTALAGKANTSHTHTVTDLATTSGTASSSTFLRGDNTWAKPRGTTATNGDAAATLTPGTSATTQVWNTALTAARAVTLAAGTDGDYFRVVRAATATGAFNLNVGTGPLKALTAASTWVDVTCVGTTWMVTAAGSL